MRARLCLWHFGGDGLPPRPSTCRGGLVPLHWSRHQALTTERASLRLLHGARRRRSQGACSSLPLALWWRLLATKTKHLHGSDMPSHRSRHQAPTTERTSLQLLHGSWWRRRRSQGACSCLPLALRWRVLIKICLLMEHARRCDAEAEAEAWFVFVSASGHVWHFGGECLPPRPSTCRECHSFAPKPPSSSND